MEYLVRLTVGPEEHHGAGKLMYAGYLNLSVALEEVCLKQGFQHTHGFTVAESDFRPAEEWDEERWLDIFWSG
jgi:hypothetical protein